MKSLFQIGLLAVSAMLLGCTPERNVGGVEKRLGEIEVQLVQSKEAIAQMQVQVKQLNDTKRWDDLIKTFDQVAYLTPGAEGYSTVRFDLGVLTVQMVDVQPYANGSKITLRFGNTLSSSINGLKATIDWGPLDEKGLPEVKSTKTKNMTFSEILRPGAWTGVQVILDGTPPADLGFVRVKDVTHTGIQLFK